MPSLLLSNQPVGPLDAYLATETGGLGRRADPAELAGIASQTGSRRYVVCNGAEGEPEGTFKDQRNDFKLHRSHIAKVREHLPVEERVS